MAQRKLPKRLFKNKDVVHTYQHERETKLGMKEMTRDHVDVLQNIEVILVSNSQQDPSIDDRTIDESLTIARRDGRGLEDAVPEVQAICENLDTVRVVRKDTSDAIWQAGLRTVQESVRRPSSLNPGEKSYLQFVSQYVR